MQTARPYTPFLFGETRGTNNLFGISGKCYYYFISFLFCYFPYIGLDPAFPLYMFVNPSSRLSADAADFVDIIHTDGGVLGYPWPLGHADFFPNLGIPLQPGCAKQELSKNRWYSILGML